MDERQVASVSDKRLGPIVQTGRVRRAGSRRQGVIAAFTLLVIGAVVAGAWLWLGPSTSTYTLTGYSASTITVQTLRSTVEIAGVVVARRTARVTTPEQGFVEQVLVSVGQWVTSGQLVAVLDAPALRDSLVSNQRALERSLREFDRFLLQHEFAMRSSDRQRAMLELEVEDAQVDVEEVEELAAADLATSSEQESARRRLEAAIASLEDHDASREETLALHELSRRNYEDDINTTRQSITDLETRLSATRITAPMTGRVISIADGALTPGVVMQQYATLIELADTRNPMVQSEIEQQYIGLIEVGHPVAVEISGSRVQGSIERIGLTATTGASGGTPVVDIDVALQVGDGEFLPGSSTLLELVTGEVENAFVLPRGPYLTSGNRQFLYRIVGATAERTPVSYGTVTGDYAQILTGVNAGDRIITSSYQGFLDRETVELGGDS